MDIKLDLKFVPDHVRALVVQYIELERIATFVDEDKISEIDKNYRKSNKISSTSITIYSNKLSLESFKVTLENMLEKYELDKLVVIEDTENENTLAIVKGGDIEQFSMYVCSHCGMHFRTEEERFVHERMI